MVNGHIGWNSWKIISRLISLTFSLSADSNTTDIYTYSCARALTYLLTHLALVRIKPAISPKRLKIEQKLLLTAYI